jgi:hypothetical protein
MPENFVTVAGFTDAVEAEIACGRLHTEGISAFMTGGETVSAFPGMSNIGGRVDLRVPAEQVARAIQILTECGGAVHLTDEVRSESDGEEAIWICPLCGEPVRAVLPICPDCHTPRGQVPIRHPEDDDEPNEGIQESPTASARPTGVLTEGELRKSEELVTASPPLTSEPEPETQTDLDVPPLATMVGDAMARRAFYAALFGFATVGLLFLYSMWLLFKLTSYRGELSARGLRYLYLAIFFDGAYLLLGILLCAGARIWG